LRQRVPNPTFTPPATTRGAGVRIGRIWIDAVTLPEALGAIEKLVDARLGGAVFTPNVDHVVLAQSNHALQSAYAHASLSLADGTPLVWLARLLGRPLPERVAGSDVFLPLMELAARQQWRVYLLGGAPGVAAVAATILAERIGVNIVGWNSPLIAADGSDLEGDSVTPVRIARPDLVVVALGNPKQELWTARAGESIRPAVALGFGAVLDFLVGRQKRAPRWAARAGLEWLYRLVHDPRRLWKRYLVQDSRFIVIALSDWWAARVENGRRKRIVFR
jgi:N-acetylglucosaminyldiphosphoundecaprenol N-acetyl-beta-D-mannosaminyltransferase